MKRSTSLRFLASFSLAAFSLGTYAQGVTVPDAGALRQQIEQGKTLPLPSAEPPAPAPLPREFEPTPEFTVTVNRFRFAGNALVARDALESVLAPYLNRPLVFRDLLLATDAVAAAYREAGWIVRVYLPEQDISEGEVLLQVVEAQFGGVVFEGERSERVLDSEIEAYFLARQALGAPLNAHGLDRALLVADDLPGVMLAGTLAAGEADGETALVLQRSDEPFLFGDIGLDNSGSRSTGSDRLLANLHLNSPGGRGELASINLLHSRGMDYGRVGLTVPLGHDGWRAGVNASALTYKVVDGSEENRLAKIRGRSSSVGLDLTYPLVRARTLNLFLAIGAEHKRFFNRDISQISADYESNSAHVAAQGNYFDPLMGGGVSTAMVQLSRGQLTNVQAHTQRDILERQYVKLNYSLARQQTLSPNHMLRLSLHGQHANEVLDSSERFYIGGANSVRAYPTSEHGGDRGQLWSLEWRWRVQPSILLTTFADAGRVVRLSQPGAPRESLNLRGYGVSVAWQGPNGFSTQLTWARRAGHNPQPTLTGTDSDGTLRQNRFWLSASLSF